MPKINSTGRIDIAKLQQNQEAKQLLQDAGLTTAQADQAAGSDKILTPDEVGKLLESLPSEQSPAAKQALAKLFGNPDLQPNIPVTNARADGPSVLNTLIAARSQANSVSATSRNFEEFGTSATDQTGIELHLDESKVITAGNLEGRDCYYFTSMSAVENASLEHLTPETKKAILEQGILGSKGAYSANSNKGTHGPIGRNALLNPSESISGSLYNPYLSWMGDAFVNSSEWNPVGKHSAMNPDLQVSNDLIQSSEFVGQMENLGAIALAGRTGVDSPVGAFGPLGPTGSHGLKATPDGDYVKCSPNMFFWGTFDYGTEPVRTKEMKWDSSTGERKEYELYEHYTENRAKELGADNDTSFMVSGELAYNDGKYETDGFKFTNNADQFVNLVVVPTADTDHFALEIYHEGKKVAESDSEKNINWIDMEVPEGAELEARVIMQLTDQQRADMADNADSGTTSYSKSYRLFVTGSTENLNQATAEGDHIRGWKPSE